LFYSIAYQLYKDAHDLLIKNYNAYLSFNLKSKEFIKDFDQFPKLGIKKVQKNYVTSTNHQKDLRRYLEGKILGLSKILRSRTWKRETSRLGISTKTVKPIGLGNVSVVIEEGIIPAKIPSKQFFGLGDSLAKESPALAIILGSFAADVLGLQPPGKHHRSIVGDVVGTVAITQAAISFELPDIEKRPIAGTVVLEVWSKESKVKEVIVPLVNPMGDIAEQAVVEQSVWLYPKLGARLATKHVIAIMAAYATYKAFKEKNEFLAKSGAVLQYVASSKGIEASEQADTRQWATIPASIRMTEFSLAPGTYKLKVRVEGKENSTKSIGQVIVENKKKKYFIQKKLNL